MHDCLSSQRIATACALQHWVLACHVLHCKHVSLGSACLVRLCGLAQAAPHSALIDFLVLGTHSAGLDQGCCADAQVILSLALPFAVIPLVQFTSSRKKMGRFVNGWVITIIGSLLCLIITGLNVYLIISVFTQNEFGDAYGAA